VALFDDTTFVDQEDAIVLSKGRADEHLMLGNNRVNRPGALANEVLQGADGYTQM
jgi:hypothetical protein